MVEVEAGGGPVRVRVVVVYPPHQQPPLLGLLLLPLSLLLQLHHSWQQDCGCRHLLLGQPWSVYDGAGRREGWTWRVVQAGNEPRCSLLAVAIVAAAAAVDSDDDDDVCWGNY